MNLAKAAYAVIYKNMHVKRHEKVLIITDRNKYSIGTALFLAAIKVSSSVKLITISVGRVNGEEPPSAVAREMLGYDVILIPTSKSLSHTKARRDATKKGARIGTLPGITEDIFVRTMKADYISINKLTRKISRILNNGSHITITTEKGTNLTMFIKGRKCMDASGIFQVKGSWGNLPDGEACLAPMEGTTNGLLIIDGSVLGKKAEKPIEVTVKEGYAVNFTGGKLASELKKTLKTAGKNAFAIAELGIGTNDKAIITGNTLEDEKVLGTAHIAFGNNKSYGGKIDVPIHIDGIFNRPTILVDKKKIIENGKLVV